MLDELTGWTGGGLAGWKDRVNERLGGSLEGQLGRWVSR